MLKCPVVAITAKQLPPNTVALNKNEHLLSHCFCGSEIQGWLSGVVLGWGLSRSRRQADAWGCPIQRRGWGFLGVAIGSASATQGTECAPGV